MTPTNKDLIRMHLEEFIKEYPGQSWGSLLAYCIGYYKTIDYDILFVVRDLHKEGKIS